jgi:DNA polymerase III gamma/tau subunit
MLGNEAIIEMLQNSLKKENSSHVYLLSGPSGCGKTTLARICAKELGADELSIEEVNTANNRGIDTARDIIERMQFLTMNGNPKIFIIDEVHSTTKDWQQAMLKPLEDTPAHVYFFLCTTDPQKLLPTIRTRTTHIKVEPIAEEELYRHVRRISKKEKTQIDSLVLKKLAANSGGSPRKALVLLEKIMNLEDEEKMLDVLEAGEDTELAVIEFCRILLKSNSWNAVAKVLRNLEKVDSEKIRYAVMGYMSAVLLKTDNYKAANILECFSEPTYNTGRNGIILAAYQSLMEE